jgi:hypothetical protein
MHLWSVVNVKRQFADFSHVGSGKRAALVNPITIFAWRAMEAGFVFAIDPW